MSKECFIQDTEDWDTEDNIPIADCLQDLSERRFKTSEKDLSWFEGFEVNYDR